MGSRKIYINYLLLFRMTLIGAFFTELLYLFFTFGTIFYNLSKENHLFLQLMIAISIIIIFMAYIFTSRKDIMTTIGRILKCKRYDLLISMITGAITVIVFDGFIVEKFYNIVNLNLLQISIIIIFPVCLLIIILYNRLKTNVKIKHENSFFLNDKAIENFDDDKLDFKDLANNFANKVYDNKSSNSLVFGIEAPWGVGKTSFINLCKKKWSEEEPYKNNIIVFDFDILKFDKKKKLPQRFTNELIKTINLYSFNPNIAFYASKLIRNIKADFRFFGLNFSLPFNNLNTNEILEKLELEISKLDKKVLIIIDNLDRLDFDTIVDVLCVIKKTFSLRNVSFVLCYDIENIYLNKNRSKEKIIEFFEKFINVKFSIYYEYNKLLNYFNSLPTNEKGSNKISINVREKAIDGLKDIFASNDFYNYLPFVGDPRKLKQLINTIKLLDIDETDFENSDFDKSDLIHLMLIYVNYPNVFRQIYVTETEGKHDYFSVKYEKIEGSSQYHFVNSSEYKKYKNKLSKEQRFLLEKVFNPEEKNLIFGDEGNKRHSAACINGSFGNPRNLEEYLLLIAHMKKPDLLKQNKYYQNIKERIINGAQIDKEVKSHSYLISNGINKHKELWKAIRNIDYYNMSYKKASEILIYMVSNVFEYSYMVIDNLLDTMRTTMHIDILLFLDKTDWSYLKDNNNPSQKEREKEICDWILGENNHKGKGILETFNKNRILGLADQLSIRNRLVLNFRAQGPKSYDNITLALFNKANPNKEKEGTYYLDVGLISQKIFSLFLEEYYIKNIFEEIDNLTEKELCGRAYEELINYLPLDFEERIKMAKSSLKIFCTYQLLSLPDNSESISIEERLEMQEKINNYFFSYCFLDDGTRGYKHFLDYMLINFTKNGYGDKYIFDIKSFIRNEYVKKTLKKYWKENYKMIKEQKFEEIDKKVFTYGYTATYKEDLSEVYKKLDELLNEKDYE